MKEVIKILLLILIHTSSVFASCIEGNCENGQGTYVYSNSEKLINEEKKVPEFERKDLFDPNNIAALMDELKEEGSKDIEKNQGTTDNTDEAIYSGKWKNGARNGFGFIKWSDESSYDGLWQNDKINGYGTYISPDGTSYYGLWKENKKNGNFTVTDSDGIVLKKSYKYDKLISICKKGNCINGEGVSKNIDGEYAGTFKNSKYHGYGTLLLASGDKYDGEWNNGKINGKGIFTWSNGNKYVGELKDNKKHGYGTYTRPNGFSYIGEWKDDLFHGKGILTFQSGITHEGEFSFGELYKTEIVNSENYKKKQIIKKKIKLGCNLTEVYDAGYGTFIRVSNNPFYLTLDDKNNQIIVSNIKIYDGLLNFTYDEINLNDDRNIVANTTIIHDKKTIHLRLELDKYSGEINVTNKKDYNNEGVTFSEKLYGNGYSPSDFGHKAKCKEKIF